MTLTPLAEAGDPEQFGGKASSLARAIRGGLPVPPGFALSWQSVEEMAAGGPVPSFDRLIEELGGRVAVRSSAVGEDSAEASFAGQHATILNATSGSSLLAALAAVRRSASNTGAVEYRARLGIEAEPRVAVVIQQMIDADVAGVLFTCNPMTHADERVIEASWGLGEAVVAGMVTPDRFRIDRRGAVIERVVGHKDIELRYAAEGTEEREVEPERQRTLCLDDAMLRRLGALASECERLYGERLDLEFAIAGGELFLLQVRPITTSAAAPAAPVGAALSPRRLSGFALAAILSPLNSTMIAVALPSIGSTFHANAASLTFWLVTTYLLVSIIAQSPAGKLADVFGYSPVLTTGRATFAAGALLGAFAPSVGVLSLARVLMAIGGSLNVPPVMAELRNQVAPERRGRLFGFFGATMGTAAAIGPLAGDLLIRRFGWHSVFLVNLPIILLSLLLEPPHRGARKERKVVFDYAGSVVFAAAIVLVVAGAGAKSVRGWIAAGIGVMLGALFIRLERRAPEPLLDPALFTIRSFTAGSSIVALQNFTMYAVLFLVPFLLAGGSAHGRAAGGFLLAMTGAMVLASPFGGRISDAIGARATTVCGGLAATLGTALLFTLGRSDTTLFVTALALLGGGIGFSTSPSQAAALSAVPRESAGVAAGALSTMRYVGGVLGSGIVGMIVAGGDTHSPLVWVFPLAVLVSAAVALRLPRAASVRTGD